ncbi:MAG: type I restriction-modification system subunit M [Aerococcus sp.]|nr:type I restriction-modification system subunit M [Aerococcus sp.]
MITSEGIKRRLWNGADNLRGTMDASRYKDYMLGLMFYKFLSDKTLQTFKETADLPDDANVLAEYRQAHEEYGAELDQMIQQVLGYHVAPEYLYQTWEEDIENGDFELSEVMDSLNAFERSITTTADSDDFKGLFSSSVIDMTDPSLGSDLNKRSKNIRDLIGLFADLNMVDLQNGDILGDAYEYLIGQFASDAGKKAGEFYTPAQVSEVIAQIIARTTDIKSIYDPTVGSGSLLLTVGKHLTPDARKNLHYYGQEYITATFNLARMNLLLHGVRPENMTIRNGNTLAADWPEDPSRPGEGVQFDAVVMNPPYSDKSWNKHEDKPLKVSDPRFSEFGVLPPESKGDFAYLMHGLYHLNQQGTMGIVLPHGVLFRGDSEGEIRKRLIEKNNIDAIIGLPSNLFTNTGIPVAILILKKNRELTDPVLVIDASNDFVKVGKNNGLRERDTAKIVDTYVNKLEITGYSHLATRQEIIENDYNLNIPRYVSANDEEIPEDVDAHLKGGIPESNLDRLTALNRVAGDMLHNAMETIRPGYVKPTVTVDALKENILQSPSVKQEMAQVKQLAADYVSRYYPQLQQVDSAVDLSKLHAEMLSDIQQLLQPFANVDEYAGFQIVADLWRDTLEADAELIANVGFYPAGRTRKPNMVTKGSGSNKRTVQEGWMGALIPTSLIADTLYADEQMAIQELTNQVDTIESELGDLVESAKTEDTPEYDALYDVVKRNKDDEPQDSFDNKQVNNALKAIDEADEGYEYLQRVSQLLSDRTKQNKTIKQKQADLDEAVTDRIEQLTDDEIDQLMHQKWFGSFEDKMSQLVIQPLESDLDTLKTLHDRYADTLDDIEAEIQQGEAELEALLQEMVVKK